MAGALASQPGVLSLSLMNGNVPKMVQSFERLWRQKEALNFLWGWTNLLMRLGAESWPPNLS